MYTLYEIKEKKDIDTNLLFRNDTLTNSWHDDITIILYFTITSCYLIASSQGHTMTT